jgi:two-component system, NarL family, sensor histidine kinase UhpB
MKMGNISEGGMLDQLTCTQLNEKIKALEQEIARDKRREDECAGSEKRLRHLYRQVLTVQEAERLKISRHLHDELGGALSALKLQVRIIEKKLRKDQVKLKEACEDLLSHIDQISEKVRELSLDLSPSIIQDLGFAPAVRQMIRGFMKNNQVHVTADIADIGGRISPDAQVFVYRIIQEAFGNIGKHAQAENASVMLKTDGEKITIVIKDDGIGFEIKQAAFGTGAGNGMGLAVMEERMKILGGEFDVWTRRNKGTKITIRLPEKKGGSF